MWKLIQSIDGSIHLVVYNQNRELLVLKVKLCIYVGASRATFVEKCNLTYILYYRVK